MKKNDLRTFAHEAVDWMVDYLEGFGDEPILQSSAPAEVLREFDEPLPTEGMAPEAVLEIVKTKVAGLATHLQHPGNFAYVPNSADMVGVVAEAIAATLNQNVSLFRGGPSAAAMERQVVRWIRQMIGYPEGGAGVLTSGGSMANLMGLALARGRTTNVAGNDPVFYMSGEIHSSVHRALRFLGLPDSATRTVPTDDDYRMRVDALERSIIEDHEKGRNPCAVIASAGTIGSGAVDPLEEISHVCRKKGMWLHVDGAYGALAATAPRGAWMRSGLARADSVSLDPHKWLFVPIDASCLLVQDADHMRRFFTLVPEYLKVSQAETESVHHPMEYTIELSRRFRALKIWMVLKVHGTDAVQKLIDHHLELAAELGDWVKGTPDFELLAPVMTSVVCFRRMPRSASRLPEAESERRLDALNTELLERINRYGGLFLSHCRLDGRFALRVCITHLRSRREDIERLKGALVEIASAVEAEMGLENRNIRSMEEPQIGKSVRMRPSQQVASPVDRGVECSGSCRPAHSFIVGSENNDLVLFSEELDRGNVKRVERSHRDGKRLKSAYEDGAVNSRRAILASKKRKASP